MEHEEDAGDRQDDEEEAGDSTETKRVGKSETMAFHLHREDMKKEVMIHEHRSLQIGVGYSRSEDGTPYSRVKNALKDPFPHVFSSL